jgi:hypothetical protein
MNWKDLEVIFPKIFEVPCRNLPGGKANIRCPSRDSNQVSPEYDPRVLSLCQSLRYAYINLFIKSVMNYKIMFDLVHVFGIFKLDNIPEAVSASVIRCKRGKNHTQFSSLDRVSGLRGLTEYDPFPFYTWWRKQIQPPKRRIILPSLWRWTINLKCKPDRCCKSSEDQNCYELL